MSKCVAFLLIALFLVSGTFVYGESLPKNKLLVSIAPYAYLVEKIVGPTASVETVVPPYGDPHLFEPSPRQVEGLLGAAIWFQMGESFEKKITPALISYQPELILVSLEEGLSQPASCIHKEGRDLHLWMSPKIAQKQVERISQILSNHFPEHRDLYQKNSAALLTQLAHLDQEISSLLYPFKGQAILVSHPAFGYFCSAYDLVQLSVEEEGKDPHPKQITSLLERCQTLSIRSILIQAQSNNKGAELIAKKLQLPTYVVDPYAKDYPQNLLHIARVIANSST